MVNYKVGSKSTFLALAVLFASISAPVLAKSSFNKKKTAGILTAFALYTRLKTKPTTNYEYTPGEDFKAFCAAWNLLKPESRAKLIDLFDKWIVGQKFSLVDTELDTIQEDGSILKVKDQKIKSKPFGVVGLFDAYVLQQLSGLDKLFAAMIGASEIKTGIKGLYKAVATSKI